MLVDDICFLNCSSSGLKSLVTLQAMGYVELHVYQTILSQVLLCVLVHYHADTQCLNH